MVFFFKYSIMIKFFFYQTLLCGKNSRSTQKWRNPQETIWSAWIVPGTFPPSVCFTSMSPPYTYGLSHTLVTCATTWQVWPVHWSFTCGCTLVRSRSSVRSVVSPQPITTLCASTKCGIAARRTTHVHCAPTPVFRPRLTKNTSKPNIQVLGCAYLHNILCILHIFSV